MIGGQDEIAFEGPSFGLNADHSLALQLPAFRPMVARIVWERGDKAGDAWKARARSSRRGKKPILRPESPGLRDHLEKNPLPRRGARARAPFPASQLAPHHPELSLAYSASMDFHDRLQGRRFVCHDPPKDRVVDTKVFVADAVSDTPDLRPGFRRELSEPVVRNASHGFRDRFGSSRPWRGGRSGRSERSGASFARPCRSELRSPPGNPEWRLSGPFGITRP